MVLIGVSGAHAAVRTQDVLTVGMIGAEAKFMFFDEVWNNLGKIAVFCQGNVTKDAPIFGDVVTIPWEVLQMPGVPVTIGVYGTSQDGKIVIPTVWAKTAPVQLGADPSGDESYPPTPDVGEQAVALASAAAEQSAELLRRADAGEFKGPKGDKGDRGDTGSMVYVQDEEPMDAEVGDVWYDTSTEEADTYEPVLSVNGQTGAVMLTASDVGALPSDTRIPVVPAWAQTPQKPDYTAEEVGALPEDTEIPASAADVGALPLPATAAVGQYFMVSAVDGNGKVTAVEAVDAPSGGGNAEMTLLAEVDCSQASGSIELTDLGELTEIYVEWNGVQNSHASTASGYYLKINGVRLGIQQFIPIQKSGSTFYGWSYAKCVGVAWIAQRSSGAIALDNEQLNGGNALFPYNTIKTGAANKIIIQAPDTQYQAVSGTIKIWGR